VRITTKILQARRACKHQVKIFEDEWPDGCTVSLETIRRAQSLNITVQWAAEQFLKDKFLENYVEARATLWGDYEEARATLWSTYVEALASLLRDCGEAEATLLWEFVQKQDRIDS